MTIKQNSSNKLTRIIIEYPEAKGIAAMIGYQTDCVVEANA